MRIHYLRSGGQGPLARRECTIDTDTLSPDEAQKLIKLVETANFFQLPATGPMPRAVWDRFQYEVSVETGGREHTVVVYEPAVPADLEPLLDQLNKLAGKTRNQ